MVTLGPKNASSLPLVNPSILVLYGLCWKIMTNLFIPVDGAQSLGQKAFRPRDDFVAPRASSMSVYKASSEHFVFSLDILVLNSLS